MAALHSALTAIGPEDFSNVPTEQEALGQYLSKLYAQCEVIVESIPPPPPPDEKIARERAKTVSSIASNASEISLSSIRSTPPGQEYQELQKTWGKPIKLSAKDNPLGMSVYKTSGKDGRGAWFARRSVHEGLGFSRWKTALAREFPESMDAPGEPWEGNIRGIGGEKKVEDISIEGKGRVEVYQLSARFPGPASPRDFITLLITSSHALRSPNGDEPRHYMIISKPCKHQECPPRDGFIRGQYESIEFIREVPRDLSSSQISLTSEAEKVSGLSTEGNDPESNPIEWIMVTRSDPGGSVPRFMVERGTPGAICGDAVKFLDWATQLDRPEETVPEDGGQLHRRASLSKWETNGYMAGVDGEVEDLPTEQSPSHSGLLSAFNDSLEKYAPQAVIDYLHQPSSRLPQTIVEEEKDLEDQVDDDATSTMTSVSFASAESHVENPDQIDGISILPQHEKELRKLRQRRETLNSKLEAAREKTSKESATASAKEAEAAKKAEEKHERELKKHEEKYKKEVARLEAKKEKETKRMEERKKKLEEKDVTKQNEALKKELDHLKKERDTMMKMIGDLTSENKGLAAKLSEKEKLASDISVTSPHSVRSSREGGRATPELAPTATAAALGVSSHRSGESIDSVSKDQIRQLIDEELESKSKARRLRGLSVGSSGTRSRASSRSKVENSTNL